MADWIETDLFSIANVATGKKDANHATEDGKYTFFTCAYSQSLSPTFSFDDKVLILPGNGANVGEVFYFDGKFEAYQRTYVINEIKIDSKYLFYHFLNDWKKEVSDKQYGSATNYIRIGNFKNYKVKIAPLKEQKRITDKLDILFEEINKNKSKFNSFPKRINDFKQQILKSAINGDLTRNWRKNNDQVYDPELENSISNANGWKVLKASDACVKVQSGSTPRNSPFTKTGDVPFLKVYNIQNQKIAFDYKPQFVTSEIHNQKLTRSIVKPNDVLMNIVGPPLGKIAIVTDEYPEWNINQAIVLFRPKKYLLPKYLYYVLCDGKQIDNIALELKGSAGQQNISLTQSRNFEFEIPSIDEQKVIVAKIDELFKLADNIEAKYLDAKEKIDDLPQAILAKAFRGELVEQDENDEPAEELLKRILEEKQKLTKKKRKK